MRIRDLKWVSFPLETRLGFCENVVEVFGGEDFCSEETDLVFVVFELLLVLGESEELLLDLFVLVDHVLDVSLLDLILETKSVDLVLENLLLALVGLFEIDFTEIVALF